MLFDYFETVESLKDLSDEQALLQLEKPTVFKVAGENSEKALLVSTLLHGSEPCGFRAFLKEINANPSYACDVYYLVGNIEAAQKQPCFTFRLLPGGENYNRIWKDNPKTHAEKIADEIKRFFHDKPLAAFLDIHSFTAKTTGPHGFISNNREETLKLATKIAPILFESEVDSGEMYKCFAKKMPALLVECGTNNTPEADEFAYQALQVFLSEYGAKQESHPSICAGIYSDMLNIKITKDTQITWANKSDHSVNITLRSDVEELNHQVLSAGVCFGWANDLKGFVVKNARGDVNPSEIFELHQNQLILRKPVVANLMTANEFIVKESGFYFFDAKNHLTT
ncbi:MAG: hypothetical protein ACE365_00710 [Gammaproteobacteria bacterium]